MRLSCPCASDRMSLLHKHLVDRTAGRQKKKNPDLRSTTSVFTSRLSRRWSARGVRTKPGLPFHLTQEQIPLYAQSKYPACLARGGNVFTVGRADVHVVRVIAPFSRVLCELKEAADRSLETQTECAAQWTLSVLRHQRANVQCALCVRARLCTLAKAPLESKCLMG